MCWVAIPMHRTDKALARVTNLKKSTNKNTNDNDTQKQKC